MNLSQEDIARLEARKVEAAEVNGRARRALLVFGGVLLFGVVLAGTIWALRYLMVL
jgi:hypothetical protein